MDDPIIEDMSDVIAVPPVAEREQGFKRAGLYDHLLIEGGNNDAIARDDMPDALLTELRVRQTSRRC